MNSEQMDTLDDMTDSLWRLELETSEWGIYNNLMDYWGSNE